VRVKGLSSADKYFSIPGYHVICTSKQVPMFQTTMLSPSSRKMSEPSPLKWRQRFPDESDTYLPNYMASYPALLDFHIHHWKKLIPHTIQDMTVKSHI
jgi:hypothetical protein